MVTKEQKAAIVAEFDKDANDTGTPRVQVALLTARIRELTEHCKQHPHDFHSRRGLLMHVGHRRSLLRYIRSNDINEYRELIAKLELRDNIQ